MSCNRSVSEKEIPIEESNDAVIYTGVLPMAILQSGEYPLWFQLTENGPVHIETIADAQLTAFVPWPYALHISFMQEKEDSLIMVVNRDGFLNITPNNEEVESISMYRFSGGELWQKYTTGGFVYYDGVPAVLLYTDNRFFDIPQPLPIIRIWTFKMDYDLTFPISIPIFDLFPAEDGWEIDTLHFADSFYYYRAAKRSGSFPSVRMFRTDDLTLQGEEISAEVFFNSVSQKKDLSNLKLPQLPDGYVYTNAGFLNGNLIASWEEQDEFYIGVAGFMVVKR
ncbi:MAG: hypothetical protein FWB86_11540 [Treponema sp.]|nr:hypothetical protein [Treponema sp.]MCL2252503.1 hypothetical protein [Treponema sp.]